MSKRTPVPLFLLLLAVLLFAPGTARADNSVVESSPEDGAVLSSSPEEISFRFSEELGDTNTIALECETELITLPRPEIADDGVTLTVEIAEPLPAGTCVSRWRVSNTDGEPNGSGSISFVVQNDTATTAPLDTTSDTQDVSTTVDDEAAGEVDLVASDDEVIELSEVDSSGPMWLGRLLSDLGIAVVFGGLVVIAAAWPEGVEYLVAVRFFRAAWIVAIIGTLLYVAVAAGAVNGESLGAGLNPATWLDLWDAGWPGRALLVRLVLVAVSAWVAFRPDRVIDPTTQTAALAIPALTTATIGLFRTGADLPVLGITMAILHALAMAVWVGGVILVARVVLAGPGEEDLVHAVRGFSRLSNIAIIGTIVTGIVMMILLDGGDLFGSSHGRAVVFKVVLVAAMLFVAMSARQFVNSRLVQQHELNIPLANRLRRAFGIEAVLGVAVLGASAWLLSFAPPNIDLSSPIDYEINHDIVIEEADVDLTVRLTNDTIGRAGLEVDVRDPETGLSNLRVILNAPPNDANIGAVVQPVPLTGRGVAVRLEENGLPLNVAGDWTLLVRGVTANGAFRSDPWEFTLLNEDGTEPTTAITLPPANTVELTTPETEP